MESWKVIYDFPNYEISNYGNVRNNTKIVKAVPNKHGYNVVVLCNGIRKSVNIHRLVAALSFRTRTTNHVLTISTVTNRIIGRTICVGLQPKKIVIIQ